MTTKQNVSQLITLSQPVGLGGERLWLCPSLSKNGDTGQAFDLSGRVNNGTYNGGMGTFVNTESGGTRAYELDGSDDYIDTGNGDSTDLRPGVDPLTFTAWIKPDTIAGGDTFSTTNPRYVIQKGSSVGARWQYGWRILGGKLDFLYRNSADTFFCILRADSSVVNAGEWQHIALVHDGTTATHYLNGSVVPSTVVSGSMSNLAYDSNEPVIIGKEQTQRYFDGLMDDVRIYSRALTAAEIKHLAKGRGIQGNGKTRLKARYNEPAGVLVPTRTNFLAWYRKSEPISKPSYKTNYARNRQESAHPNLWDGLVGAWMPSLGVTGGTLRDSSGNNNHGTLTNMDPGTDWVATKKGWALDFDGTNDYVDTGINPSFDSVTISCWFQYRNSNNQVAVGRFQGTGSPWETPGTFRIPANAIIGIATADGYVELNPNSNLTFSEGEWVNAVFAYDGTTYRSYHQGLPGGTASYSHTFASISGQNIYIGRRSSSATLESYFNGQISNVLIYDRALSASEIKQLYIENLAPFKINTQVQAGVPVPTRTNFLAWYRKSWAISKPNYRTGYARNRQESAHPNLWRGLIAAYVAPMGQSGFVTRFGNSRYGLKDLSRRGNEMVFVPAFMNPSDNYVSSRFGTAISFNGTDEYMETGDYADVLSFGNGTSDSAFSISGWVKTSSTSAAVTLLGKGSGSPNNEYVVGSTATNAATFRLYDQNGGDQIYVEGPTDLTTDTWYHITGTYDGSGSSNGLKIYVNGKDVSSTRGSQGTYVAMHNTSANTRIGRFVNTYREQTFLEVYVYDREIKQSEIKQLYVNKFAPFRIKTQVQAGVAPTNFLAWCRNLYADVTSQIKTLYNPIGIGGEKGWYCPSLSKNRDTGQAFDLSGNANHCTYNGGMVAATKIGKGGSKAYEFLNSGDYISGLPFYFNQDFTYSGWINATDLTSDAFYLFGDGNTQTIRVPAGSDPGTWQSIIKGYTPDRVQIASAISSGVWHHVVTVIRGSNHEVWIDGELAGKVAITGTGSAPSFNRIGYGFGGDNGVGYADDARVYQRALTPSEIKHLSKGRGIQGKPKQPIRNRYLPSILIEVLQRVRRGILSFFIDI